MFSKRWGGTQFKRIRARCLMKLTNVTIKRSTNSRGYGLLHAAKTKLRSDQKQAISLKEYAARCLMRGDIVIIKRSKNPDSTAYCMPLITNSGPEVGIRAKLQPNSGPTFGPEFGCALWEGWTMGETTLLSNREIRGVIHKFKKRFFVFQTFCRVDLHKFRSLKIDHFLKISCYFFFPSIIETLPVTAIVPNNGKATYVLLIIGEIYCYRREKEIPGYF